MDDEEFNLDGDTVEYTTTAAVTNAPPMNTIVEPVKDVVTAAVPVALVHALEPTVATIQTTVSSSSTVTSSPTPVVVVIPNSKPVATAAEAAAASSKLLERAARFGLPPTDDVKKATRAERFGDMLPKVAAIAINDSNKSIGKKIISEVMTEEEKLKIKQRAERFGVVVAPILSKEVEVLQFEYDRFKLI